tara:strand:+ start:327 stop:545 length:219 start_codon:yes stop_codon:yes gene_type:complete
MSQTGRKMKAEGPGKKAEWKYLDCLFRRARGNLDREGVPPEELSPNLLHMKPGKTESKYEEIGKKYIFGQTK